MTIFCVKATIFIAARSSISGKTFPLSPHVKAKQLLEWVGRGHKHPVTYMFVCIRYF